MKIFKKSIMICLLLLLAVGLINRPHASSHFASAADEEVIDNGLFNYVSITKYGEVLNYENLNIVDNTTYIVTNDSLTINLKPFEFDYNTNALSNSNFYPVYDSFEITAVDDTYPESFEFNETTYYFRINNESEYMNIYLSQPSNTNSVAPIISTSFGNTYTYEEDTENKVITVTYIKSYTLKSNAPDTEISLTARAGSTANSYNINFLRPVIEFANSENPIVEFTCNGLDAGNSEYKDTTIRREQSYNNVKIEFLSNDYSEFNPLYFLLNSDGFIYTFELYSKVYDGEKLLFVNYFDDYNENDNRYLGTHLILDQNDEYVIDPLNRVYAEYSGNINTFSLVFTKTGRYSFEVYDSTYVLGLKNANYYSTSFFIKDEANTPFENIYIISQTQDDEGNALEYIVSTSNLNNNVKTTVKNLTNLGKDAQGKNINLEDVIENIEVRKTTFGGSTNIPTKTIYTPAEILKQMDGDDFNLFFDEDAYYEITIRKKNSTEITYHEFTIVKHAKTTFTIPLVDENGEPIFDDEGKQKTTTYEASELYKTEIINYEKNILSSMQLSTKFDINANVHEQRLHKTFINKYTISYGKEGVSIKQVEIEVGENEKKVDKIDLNFFGVGNLRVEVTFNGKTTVYTEIDERPLSSESGNNLLTFTEYGVYTVKLVDSMGTETVQIFELKKKLNVSALALIILSSLLAAIIAIFVLRARGKDATR